MRLREQLLTDVLGDHNTPLSVGYKTKTIFRELQTFFFFFYFIMHYFLLFLWFVFTFNPLKANCVFLFCRTAICYNFICSLMEQYTCQFFLWGISKFLWCFWYTWNLVLNSYFFFFVCGMAKRIIFFLLLYCSLCTKNDAILLSTSCYVLQGYHYQIYVSQVVNKKVK